MNQFVLQQGSSKELRLFPQILELGIKKNISIQFNSFPSIGNKWDQALLCDGRKI